MFVFFCLATILFGNAGLRNATSKVQVVQPNWKHFHLTQNGRNDGKNQYLCKQAGAKLLSKPTRVNVPLRKGASKDSRRQQGRRFTC
jgi:hypothetical protein